MNIEASCNANKSDKPSQVLALLLVSLFMQMLSMPAGQRCVSYQQLFVKAPC